jgi:hypothetical protein
MKLQIHRPNNLQQSILSSSLTWRMFFIISLFFALSSCSNHVNLGEGSLAGACFTYNSSEGFSLTIDFKQDSLSYKVMVADSINAEYNYKYNYSPTTKTGEVYVPEFKNFFPFKLRTSQNVPSSNYLELTYPEGTYQFQEDLSDPKFKKVESKSLKYYLKKYLPFLGSPKKNIEGEYTSTTNSLLYIVKVKIKFIEDVNEFSDGKVEVTLPREVNGNWEEFTDIGVYRKIGEEVETEVTYKNYERNGFVKDRKLIKKYRIERDSIGNITGLRGDHYLKRINNEN